MIELRLTIEEADALSEFLYQEAALEGPLKDVLTRLVDLICQVKPS